MRALALLVVAAAVTQPKEEAPPGAAEEGEPTCFLKAFQARAEKRGACGVPA